MKEQPSIVSPKKLEEIQKEVLQLFLAGDFALFKWENKKNWPVIAVTENVVRVLGYETSQWLDGTLNYGKLIHPADIKRVVDKTNTNLKSGTEDLFHIPYRVRRSDGQYTWLYESTRVAKDIEGRVTHFIGYIVDISRIVERENKIQSLEERFELVVLATGDGVWDWDVLTDEVWYSERLKEMLGYQDDEMGNSFLDWKERLHPQDKQKTLNTIERHFQHKTEFYESMYRLRCKNGTWKWILGRGKALFNMEGKPYRMLGFHTDMTKRKRIEEELRLYAKIFENSEEGITITDAHSHIISVNDAFTKITGYERNEVIGKTPAILSSGRHHRDFYEKMWKSLIEKGSWEGEIYNRKKTGEIYPEWISIFTINDDEDKMIRYAAIFSNITPLKKALEKSDHLSHYDTLTQLPNLSLLHDRVDQALINAKKEGKKAALLYMDLDHFKNLNDSLGHNIGDRFLQEVASLLKDSIRPNDTLSRQGGDEFVVLLCDIDSEYEIIKITEEICTKMQETISIDEHKITSSFSIGIAVSPEDGTSFETLLQHADTAMYQAKKSGRNMFQFFKSEMNALAEKKYKMHMALNQAIEKNELSLHFQPQLDITSKRIFGAEALLRWTSSELGSVSPAEFIPIAEETGLIIPIGKWILEEACAHAKAWKEDADMPELVISVNISVLQFKQPDFQKIVMKALQMHSLDAKYIELELTETLLIQDMEQNLQVLNALKECGVKFSIDDFGTGYSSLSYLKEIPASQLKIDQSFIKTLRQNKDDEAIVNSVISLGKHFGMQVIAEGVETQEDLDFLEGMQCHEAQGYHISRPLPAKAFEDFIKKQTNF